MGVYLCLGQPVHKVTHADALEITRFQRFQDIHEYVAQHGKIFVYMGQGEHKIKRNAEQAACYQAIGYIRQLGGVTQSNDK